MRKSCNAHQFKNVNSIDCLNIIKGMPLFREENFLVVHAGSQFTLFSFGLRDSLAPPQYRIPTAVYLDETTSEFRASNTGNLTEIRPIKAGRITNVAAFQALLKFVLQTVVANHPIITINQIPLLLIVPSLSFSRDAIEKITQYVFETLELTAFNILDLSIASTFGLLATTSSVVVNVGHETSQVMPVIAGSCVKFAGRRINAGGHTIDQELKRLLPSFTDAKITALKSSPIFEVLNDHHQGSFYSLADLKDSSKNADQDGEIDVAKIVTEENGQIKTEGSEEEEEQKPNNELEKNWFKDPGSDNKIFVGKERFQGTDKLVLELAQAIYSSLLAVPDIDKRQECYDNIIFTGSTFHIQGLKHAIILKLCELYLATPPTSKSGKDNGSTDVNSAIAAYQQGDDGGDGSTRAAGPLQVPHLIRIVKHPEYFPEWKKPKEKGGSWHDVYFLGGEIYCKQIFGTNSNHGGDSFMDTDIYEERGPQAIWDVTL